MEKLKKVFFVISNAVFMTVAFGPMRVLAETAETAETVSDGSGGGSLDISWITNQDNHAFDNVTNTVKGYTASGFNLMQMLFIGIAVLAAMCALMRLLSNNAQKKTSAKDSLFWIAIAVVIASAVLAIIEGIWNIGSSIEL